MAGGGSGGCGDVLQKLRGSGVVSLLRFFRRINRLGEIDKFASAPDADSAIAVLRNLASWVMRNVAEVGGRRICYYKYDVGSDEKVVYEYLCGRRCVREVDGRYVVEVPCPRLPSDEEVEELYRWLRDGCVRPDLVALLALSRGR